MMKLSDKYNAAMNNDDSFDEYLKDLLKGYKKLVNKYPGETFPLQSLITVTCKSNNQTEHIRLLNKMIELNGSDMQKKTLKECKKQPCNKCSVWDNVQITKVKSIK